MEIERDETYGQSDPKYNKGNDINHKEFLTWREFMSYFNDYKDIEARNKKVAATSESLRIKKADTVDDPEAAEHDHMLTLMEKEKERRLKELP
jgi:hypothetical protein